jgi:hypothetical protein
MRHAKWLRAVRLVEHDATGFATTWVGTDRIPDSPVGAWPAPLRVRVAMQPATAGLEAARHMRIQSRAPSQ